MSRGLLIPVDGTPELITEPDLVAEHTLQRVLNCSQVRLVTLPTPKLYRPRVTMRYRAERTGQLNETAMTLGRDVLRNDVYGAALVTVHSTDPTAETALRDLTALAVLISKAVPK